MPHLKLETVSIHYESRGAGKPLLFIHGLGSSSRDWERQAEVFENSYRVVTVDLRGHGKFDKPPGPYSVEMFSDDVAAVLEILDLEPVSVVGISLGGMVAFQLAADRPELIDKLVVVNALPDNDLLANARRQILIRKLIVRFLGLRKMGEVLANRLFPDAEMEEERRLMAERWAENDKSAYQRSFQALIDWPGVTERLAEFDRPALMISSDEDYVSLEEKQPYLGALPWLRHQVITDARHAVPMERPGQFNQVLGDFLADTT